MHSVITSSSSCNALSFIVANALDFHKLGTPARASRPLLARAIPSDAQPLGDRVLRCPAASQSHHSLVDMAPILQLYSLVRRYSSLLDAASSAVVAKIYVC